MIGVSLNIAASAIVDWFGINNYSLAPAAGITAVSSLTPPSSPSPK